MAKENCSMCGGKGYYCEFSTLETCFCVEPATKADEISELRAEVDKFKRLIAERWKPAVERLRGQVDHLINQNMPREPIPDMPGWSRVVNADRLVAQNAQLRHLCICALQYEISENLRMQICTALEDQRHG